MLDSIQQTVLQLLPARKKTGQNGWTSFNAPCCVHNGETADTRGRGGVKTNAGQISYHCFNCGYTASFIPGRHLTFKFRKLLAWLGADDLTVRRLVIEAVRLKELVAPEELEKLPEAIRTRVLRICAVASGVHPGPFSFEHIEAIDALVKNWHGQGNVDLPGFIQATRVDGSLRFISSKH